MRVMGLDLSLAAPGIAVVDPPGPPMGRLVKVRPTLRGAERLVEIAHTVRASAAEFKPDLVAIEGYSFGSRIASHAHAIGELGGVVRYLLYLDGHAVVEVPPAKWRKQLFGRGNLPKDQVRVEALKRYGVEWDSLDVLEAWCVATSAYRAAQGIDMPGPVRRRQRGESDEEFAARARRAAS